MNPGALEAPKSGGVLLARRWEVEDSALFPLQWFRDSCVGG